MYASRMFHSSGNDPIEHLRSAGELGSLQRYVLLQHVERRPHAASGQAAAERKELPHELVRLPSEGFSVHLTAPNGRVH